MGIQVYWYTGIQVYRYTGIQVYRYRVMLMRYVFIYENGLVIIC